MRLINCQRCRKPFMSLGQKICAECVERENEAFEIIRDYLDKHPQAGLYQIAEDTGIDEGIIISLVHRGRLKSVEKGDLTHKCARCGTEVLIVDGDFCDRCQRELQSKVRRAVKELEWKTNPEDLEADDRAQRGDRPASKTDSDQAGMFIRELHRRREGER